MGNPHNHHLVPESYLKEFANESSKRLQVYHKKFSKKSKPKTSAQIAYEIDAFTIKSDETLALFQIEDKYKIERETFRKLENNYPKILTKIKSTIGSVLYINKDDAIDLIGLLLSIKRRSHGFRTPFLDAEARKEDALNQIQEMMPYIREAAKIAGQDDNLEASLREHLDNIIGSKDKLYDRYLLQLMNTEIVDDLINRLRKLKWVVLRAPVDSHFITSDNPGFSIDESNRANNFGGFGGGFIFIFPLTPRHSFFITDRYQDSDTNEKKALFFHDVSSEEVIMINKTTIDTASEKVFANSYSSIQNSLHG